MVIDPTDLLEASFPRKLQLPEATPSVFRDAADAVRQEHRRNSKWHELRCRSATLLPGDNNQSLFVLEVGHAIDLDWSWEGAIAFRPPEMALYKGDSDVIAAGPPAIESDDESTDESTWEGEIVEVDEAAGKIYVAISDPQNPPRRGSFLIRPFEFLQCLHDLYRCAEQNSLAHLLDERLAACRGGIHPALVRPASQSIPELVNMWKFGWSVLWGPPGTGKTYTLGRQVAATLADPTERVLVVSTTNRATDEAALSIGKAVGETDPTALTSGRVLRIGKGASYHRFADQGLLDLLKGTETEALHFVSLLQQRLEKLTNHDERAHLRLEIKRRLRDMRDLSGYCFSSPDVRVVVSTACRALWFLRSESLCRKIASGTAPFTTVIIDEAGLISRAATAAIALLAAWRVSIVGDGKQLAPISKISRVLPTKLATWLDSSGVSHLRQVDQAGTAVHLLRQQHRMHPHISGVVSHFQYDGELQDAPSVVARRFSLPDSFVDQPRAIWYVLDDDVDDLASVRAERGPGNRSWIRRASESLITRLFRDPTLVAQHGLFISPFKAQARKIGRFFASAGATNWTASTVHSQQGSEADIVIFDTVNAGSYSWPYDEWKRLVNVGLSRARELVLVLASRAEMNEPYLKPLLPRLAPRVLTRAGQSALWTEVTMEHCFAVPPEIAENPELLGQQLASRKSLRPVMSAEQERLCGLQMDGGARLVRGVAGSGKTWVLAHWLQKTIQQWQDRADAKVWAIYANQALRHLIAENVEAAWRSENSDKAFPWNRVELLHVRKVLEQLLGEIGAQFHGNDWDYDAAAGRILAALPPESFKPRCQAMFIDEAQDLGPNTLKVLAALVQPTNPNDPRSRSVNIFYDNAQNIYGRSTPTWSEIGLDMRGRSTVMKESFRSTKPITEFALNVLYMLESPDSDPDHVELIERGLVEAGERLGKPWWNVRFNQIHGPAPEFRRFPSHQLCFDAVGERVLHLVTREGVLPSDITVIVHRGWAADNLQDRVTEKWRQAGIQISFDKSNPRTPRQDTVIVCTSHSFKGYEAEVVLIAGVEQFVLRDTAWAKALYVAMTRARSVLSIYGWARADEDQRKLLAVLKHCEECFATDPRVPTAPSRLDDLEDVTEVIGEQYREWLEKLWRSHDVQQGPFSAANGEILAEPLFWFEHVGRPCLCFGHEVVGPRTREKLEDAGAVVVEVGAVAQKWARPPS